MWRKLFVIAMMIWFVCRDEPPRSQHWISNISRAFTSSCITHENCIVSMKDNYTKSISHPHVLKDMKGRRNLEMVKFNLICCTQIWNIFNFLSDHSSVEKNNFVNVSKHYYTLLYNYVIHTFKIMSFRYVLYNSSYTHGNFTLRKIFPLPFMLINYIQRLV